MVMISFCDISKGMNGYGGIEKKIRNKKIKVFDELSFGF